MNLQEVRALAEILRDFGLSQIRVRDGDSEVCLRRSPADAPEGGPVSGGRVPRRAGSAESSPAALPDGLSEVTSPMIGVFHVAPQPGAEPFAAVGSRVKQGDVLCILEAMKLMNDITADRDGVVAEIRAAEGDVVEFGQVLFTLRDA